MKRWTKTEEYNLFQISPAAGDWNQTNPCFVDLLTLVWFCRQAGHCSIDWFGLTVYDSVTVWQCDSVIVWLTAGLQTAQYRSTVMLTVMKMEPERLMLDSGYRNLKKLFST